MLWLEYMYFWNSLFIYGGCHHGHAIDYEIFKWDRSSSAVRWYRFACAEFIDKGHAIMNWRWCKTMDVCQMHLSIVSPKSKMLRVECLLTFIWMASYIYIYIYMCVCYKLNFMIWKSGEDWAWHTEKLDSSFNFIRSHHQCKLCSSPLEIEPGTAECRAETLPQSNWSRSHASASKITSHGKRVIT